MCKNKQAASKLAGGDKYMRKTSDIGAKKAQDDFMEDQDAVNLAADWADISQGLRKDLGHQLHSQWIKPIQVGGIDRDTGTLDLFLPTEFSANWVKDRFADRLSLAWKIARSASKLCARTPATAAAGECACAHAQGRTRTCVGMHTRAAA